MSPDERRTFEERVNSLPWYHQIDLGDGILSPGMIKLEMLHAQADAYFQMPLAGRTVLDVGCWDGFNSFEARRRGAARVLATDHFAWSDKCWGRREAFDLAHARVAPEIEVMDIDIPDMTPDRIGIFDVVLFCGVLYHLRNPLQSLETVAKLVGSALIIETHLDAHRLKRPAMVFYPGAELGNDPTNWWGPNIACVTAMLKDVGFDRIAYTKHPSHSRSRGIFHAYRQ